MGESLGPAVRLNQGYEHYWAYVSHFVHAPFYVYAYAFGNLLVRGPDGGAPRGSGRASRPSTRTCSPPAARAPMSRPWRPFGLDPREKRLLGRAAARELERLVDEFEALV